MPNSLHSWTRALAGACVLAAVCTANAQTSVAGAQSDVEAQLMLCAARVTDSARLACYDGLAEGLRSSAPKEMQVNEPAAAVAPAEPAPPPVARAAVDPTTGAPVPVSEQTPATRNRETFDLDVQQKQSIRVMIEKTKRNARGDWYFYFDNDEVWKQIDTRNRRIPPLPVAATVSRGLFSSHKLHIDGEVWAMKIRRVK